MYKLHTHCRACDFAKPGPPGIKNVRNERLVEVLDLGIQPLANDFQDERGEHSGFAPLKVLFCPRCTLAQLSVAVRPEILYSNYSYVTSATETMRSHFHQLWLDICRESDAKKVLEIGSNTGDFLDFVRHHGAGSVMGIDPAENLCAVAAEKHIPSLASLFNRESAQKAEQLLGGASVVVARHVFCHVDDWRDFIRNLSLVGDRETIFCIEVPYAKDMLAINSWDQIYHEHLSYLTLKSVDALLENSDFHIHRIIRYPIHGGAIVLMLRRDASKESPDPESMRMVREESFSADEWKNLSQTATVQQKQLKSTIEELLSRGSTVAGFGASAKSTVWINACGLTRKHIRFICDSTPQKQFRFSPGSEIPIADEGALLRERPDYAVCFAWNFLPEIIEKQSLYLNQGGRFIVPVPDIRIAP